ncbi:hypothetical protein [Poseidonibacter lekithochrous]|uniref:hypothetical protein n=1 Tax=Poseidonibacter lekithochrous TaxID=1904463 RepID=UPI0008FC97F4|nr:hypothetical protein [Poseidonibacter lekithochrous]QKJ24604.1 hypothetical protein ALEK_3408 [Poseidonibacter lekithochrous]
MSLIINDKNICLNDVVISQKAFLEQDVIEVVNIKKEYQPEFYNLKNSDICDNIEIYCDSDNCSLNLFKENDKTFISKAVEIFDKDESISIESFNKLIKEKFSKVEGIDIIADEDSIEDSLNLLLSTQLNDTDSVKDANTKIENAYNELLKKIF